jgi:serine/threonine-protein kinase RsbT
MAPLNPAAELRIGVRGAVDVERARRAARALAGSLEFARIEQEMVVLSVSELATNLARYAIRGEIVLRCIVSPETTGLQVESRDRGPGIPDPAPSHGLGAGLAGVRRLMDDFTLRTDASGTIVVCHKWRSAR